ncbi:DNA-directed RNA polymerases IV and V subunit 2, partial [Mucuna pruriens]
MFRRRNKEVLGKEILKEGDREVIIGKLPVMVKSDLCWMKDAEKDDGEFDHGGIGSLKRKACFLAYRGKGLLLAYTGCRRCDNGDNLQNKKLKLASELLEHELKVHIAHARRQMSKAL